MVVVCDMQMSGRGSVPLKLALQKLKARFGPRVIVC